MAEDHDRAYRLLFSNSRMVEDLVRLFVGGEWVKRLDFSTLDKVPERGLSEKAARREEDLLWRVNFHQEEEGEPPYCYIYLQLEFQSRSYRYMALRTVTYTALLYEDLVRRKKLSKTGKLPPVLSIVVYTGERPWKGPTNLQELIETIPDPPEGMELTQFRLVEARSLAPEKLQAAASPVADLFRLEQARQPEEVGTVTEQLAQRLHESEDLELRGAFIVFLKRVILQRLALSEEDSAAINNLEEAITMIAQKIERWGREIWQKGVAEGKAEGKAEGRAEGEARGKAMGFRQGEAQALLRLLEKRFGELPPRLRERVEGADVDSLHRWLDRTLTAESLEQIFHA